METKKSNRRAIWVIVGAFLVSGAMILGMSWLTGSQDVFGMRKAMAGDTAVTVTVEDISDENGKFIILDYPEYDVLSYVDLADYREFIAEVDPVPEITEEDIDDNIRSYVIYNKRYDRVETGVVHKDDRVEITYTGYLDGQAVSNYSVDKITTVLGAAGEPDSFVDAFDGTNVGDNVEFDVTFAEDWNDDAVAGKTVHFKGVVSALMITPDVTDENVSEITDGKYETLDAFREYIREELASYDKSVYEGSVSASIAQFLMTQSKFKPIPKELVAWYVSMQMKYYQDMADSYKMSVADYLKDAGISSSLDDFIYLIANDATQPVHRYMALSAVAVKEGITLDDTDPDDQELINARYDEIMAGLGLENHAAVDKYYGKGNIYNDVLNWKTLDWLVANVKVAPKTVDENNN